MRQNKTTTVEMKAPKTKVEGPPQIEDKSKMIMEVTPGKKGCTSTFPWGGKMIIPPGVFNKKDKLIAKIVSPTERHIHLPTVEKANRLISEMVLFVARNYQFSKPISVEIPFSSEDFTQRDLKLMAKLAVDQHWTTIEEYTVDAKVNSVKFETACAGLFVVTSSPRTERFEVTPQGCLFNARINRYITVRIPKKATTDKSLTCEIKIEHVQPEKIDLILHEFQTLCNDFESISNFYDINFLENDSVTFRRSVSIKLPITMCLEDDKLEIMETDQGEKDQNIDENEKNGESYHENEKENNAVINNGNVTENGNEKVHENGNNNQNENGNENLNENGNAVAGRKNSMHQDNLVVLHKTNEGWKLIEQTLKFTQTSVSFDVKTLGRFCLVRHKPGRIQRLRFAMPTIEEMSLILKGEILVSASLCEKTWRVLCDVTDIDLESVISSERTEAKWKLMEKDAPTVKTSEEENNYARRRFNVPKDVKEVVDDPQTKPLNLYNGVIFRIQVSGDMQLAGESHDDPILLQYHEKLTDNYTFFDVAPKRVENPQSNSEGSTHVYTGSVDVFAHSLNDINKENGDKTSDVLVRKFLIRYDQKQLDDYYYVEPVPEVVEKVEVTEPEPAVIAEKPKPVKPKPAPQQSAQTMTRLTRPRQQPSRLQSKEPKVLSGRSLKILSGAVEHGLTLAVHLNLPDSTITGIGFDSIATGLSMQDVTYKVLMHWKRTFKGSKDEQVQQLVDSIKDLGRVDISAVVMDRYRRDIELSPDCFDY